MAKSFLQSRAWLAFLASEGKATHGQPPEWQWVERSLGFLGTYWYGGLLRGGKEDVVRVLREACDAGVTFLRVSPADTETFDAFVLSVPSMRRVADAQPSTSLVLDLRADEAALLSQFKTKTRYDIGVAQRHGVRVEVRTAPLDEATFSKVWELYAYTAGRHGIRNHPRAHYANAPGEWVLSWLGDELLNAHFCVGHDGVYTYLYGASSAAHKDAMASYLTQWATIRHAKSAGYTAYDFWGIAPDAADATHPYHGITRFKMGFGGEVVRYPGTFEIPIARGRYMVYRLAKFVRLLIRRT